MELYLTFGIIAFGVFLFVKEYFTIDTSSLLIMTMFIVTSVLSPEEGFYGFIHPATITLGCMFVLSSAIFKSGIIDGLSSKIIKIAKIHYLMALLVFSVVTAVLSAFINDAAVVAIMIPLALLVCKETNIAPSKLLIPISFAACFGGASTLIGTGTNILVSSYAEKSGLEGFGMFEFSKAALVLSAVGFVYLFLIAPFLLPKRTSDEGNKLEEDAENYTTEITLQSNCPDIDKTISKSKLVNDFKAEIFTVTRQSEVLDDLSGDFILKEQDNLKILISPEELVNLQQAKGFSINGYNVINDLLNTNRQNNFAHPDDVPNEITKQIVKVLVPVGSKLAGKSLKELNFKNAYDSTVLAMRQRDETILKNLNQIKIKEGDLLLMHTSQAPLQKLTSQNLVFVISHYQKKTTNIKKAIPAVLITIGVVAAASLNFTSILMSGLIGCLLLLTTNILKPQEAYEAIDWKVIFMMAGVLSMGMALEKTGGSALISHYIFRYLGQLDPRLTLSFVFLVTFLSTNILSSRASAALMTPIVISLASAMQVSERPFLVAVMFACAFTFMTPVCNPTNTMVYTPGNYKFNDYLKVGTPLNIIIWIVASFSIPYFFPF